MSDRCHIDLTQPALRALGPYLVLRMALALIAGALLSGCGTTFTSRNVFFGEQRGNHVASGGEADVIRLYFDRQGALYPDVQVPIADSELRMTRDQSLMEYFLRSNSTCSAGNDWTGVRRSLCQLPQTEAGRRVEAWRAVQDELFTEAARTVRERLSAKPRPLFVLIHGYRVADAESDYRKVRAKVTAHPNSGVPLFLQVHWDGLKSPTPAFAWSRAQANGFLVGLSLRRVLKNLSEITQVRVMTHSSGAFVFAATVGDPGAVFGALGNESTEYREFRENASGSDRFPIPRNADLRAAMVVPATPPESFAGGPHAHKEEKALHHHAGVLAPVRLIIGANPRDFGVTKAILPGNWSLLGSSSLGTSFNYFCGLRDAVLSRQGSAVPKPLLVDMRSPEHKKVLLWDEHAWTEYLHHAPMNRLLDLLLDAVPGAGDERCLE